MKKFKSYGFWSALAGAVTLRVNVLGKYFSFSIADEMINDIIMAVAGVLVVLGVVSMPNNETTENKTDEKTTEEKTTEDKTEDNK
jgi:uncharacterized membrane protein